MSTRSDLKENILATKVEGVLAWVLTNRVPVIATAAVAALVLLFGSVVVLRNRERREINITRMALAQSFLMQHQYDRAYQAFEELKPTVSDNNLLAQALYYQGASALGLKKFDDAEKLFSEAVDRSAKSPLKPLALSNMGFAQESKKNYEAAAQTYERFMSEFGEHFLAARVQLNLGRALAAANKIDDAKKALGHLIDLYPTSHWAENARSIMDKLKTR